MSSSETTLSAPSSRNVFIDHLRVCLTALVILHHCAIVYGGSGGWYWRQEPDSSNRLLILFNATNQSYFMGFFFLLAGYFTPASFDRKGARAFLADRGLRLGLPLLGYFFILSPLTIALARMSGGHPFWPGWLQMIQLGKFEPGPLWFAEALLIFALIYAGMRRWRGPARDWEQLPRGANMALAAAITGAVAFLVRLVVPVGQNVLWLQLGYFPAYILLFIAGCFAARARLLEKVTWPQARPWAIVSLVSFVLLLVVMVTRGGQGGFQGGLNLNAAFYALWDPFISFGIILTLLWFFRSYLPTGNQFTDALARRAYGAYILHPPVLVGFSLLAREWTALPLLKFGVVGAAACVGSFAAASVLVVIPGARKIV